MQLITPYRQEPCNSMLFIKWFFFFLHEELKFKSPSPIVVIIELSTNKKILITQYHALETTLGRLIAHPIIELAIEGVGYQELTEKFPFGLIKVR